MRFLAGEEDDDDVIVGVTMRVPAVSGRRRGWAAGLLSAACAREKRMGLAQLG